MFDIYYKISPFPSNNFDSQDYNVNCTYLSCGGVLTITYFQRTLKEVEAKREYFDYHKKRELEEHLLIKLHSYVLGMSNLFKYRLKIWSSGDIAIDSCSNPIGSITQLFGKKIFDN